MDVTPLLPEGHQVINAYGGGGFKIAEQPYEGSVLIFPEHTESWEEASLEDDKAEALIARLCAHGIPEIVVLGCGKNFTRLPVGLRKIFRTKNISVEMMDTGAACRTYNILLAEGRRVAAALIAV